MRASVRTLASLRPAAGAADRDHRVRAVVRQRGFERQAVGDGAAALAVDRERDQGGGAANDVARAGAHHAHARLAHRDALDAERRQQRDVDRGAAARPKAGT